MPVSAVIAQVALLRQHVAHRSGFHRGQFLFVDGRCDGLNHLSFRASSEDQVRLLDGPWKVGTCCCRIKADGTTQLGIPKLRVIDGSCPGTFYDAHETVLPFDGSFVAVTSEDQDLSV